MSVPLGTDSLTGGAAGSCQSTPSLSLVPPPGVVKGTGQAAPLGADQTGRSGPPSGVVEMTSLADCHVRQPAEDPLLSGSLGVSIDQVGGMLDTHFDSLVSKAIGQSTLLPMAA